MLIILYQNICLVLKRKDSVRRFIYALRSYALIEIMNRIVLCYASVID